MYETIKSALLPNTNSSLIEDLRIYVSIDMTYLLHSRAQSPNASVFRCLIRSCVNNSLSICNWCIEFYNRDNHPLARLMT